MSSRHALIPGAVGRRAALARAIAIAVAVGAIGAGTWVLGSGPDSPAVAEESSQTSTFPGLAGSPGEAFGAPGAPVITEPPLSVAPVPPVDRESARATRTDRAQKAPKATQKERAQKARKSQ